MPTKPAVAIPRAPAGLSTIGRALWRRIWRNVPWLQPEQHFPAVEELCRLADELASYREALAEHGPLIREPIVTRQGKVVGSKILPNPAERMARRALSAIQALWKELGLTPQARARLGLDTLVAEKTFQTITIRERKSRP